MEYLNKYKLAFISVISFYSIFVFDMITKILLIYNVDTFNRYSLIPKLIVIVVMLFVILNSFSFKKDKYLVGYFITLILSVLAFLVLYNEYLFNVVHKQIYILLLYSYPFILVAFYNRLTDEAKNIFLKSLKKPIIIIGLIGSITMLLGLLSNIELFRAYEFSDRFGYNGIFLKTSETSYYYISLIILTSYKAKLIFKDIILPSVFILSGLFIGTKIVWLFLGLSVLFFLGKKYKKITISLIFSGLITYVLFKKPIDSTLVKFLPNGNTLYQKNGLATVLTSTRDLLLENTINFVNSNWTTFNYFFGGNKYWRFKVELEFFDLFFLFGFFGLLLYVLFICYSFFKPNKNNYMQYMLIVFFICVFFAGNFFKSFISFSVFYLCYKIINIKHT